MTQEEQQAAEAFIKLHENVNELILNTVAVEIRRNPHGDFANAFTYVMQQAVQNEMRTYRVTKVGHTATQY